MARADTGGRGHFVTHALRTVVASAGGTDVSYFGGVRTRSAANGRILTGFGTQVP